MRGTFIVVALLALAGALWAQDEARKDSELGLSKESVFETPQPIVARDSGGDPGENAPLAVYFEEGIPPMIPHSIEDMLPIRADENLCVDCHDVPEAIGEEVAEGDPTPIPVTHYVDWRHDPSKVGEEVVGARWVCVQCHAPQTDAEPLVVNTQGG
jgi:cytochrome c-type protein NapB